MEEGGGGSRAACELCTPHVRLLHVTIIGQVAVKGADSPVDGYCVATIGYVQDREYFSILPIFKYWRRQSGTSHIQCPFELRSNGRWTSQHASWSFSKHVEFVGV